MLWLVAIINVDTMSGLAQSQKSGNNYIGLSRCLNRDIKVRGESPGRWRLERQVEVALGEARWGQVFITSRD